MVPEDAPKTESEQSSGPPQRARRGRHSGRGRRGRGGRGRRPPPRSDAEEPPPRAEPEPGDQPYAETPAAEAAPEPEGAPEVEQAPPPHLPPPRQPASPASIQRAIDDVNRIIETLRESLDDMEEILETLELAERQKTADEHEIEQLRRSLRHLQHPKDRDRGHSRENR